MKNSLLLIIIVIATILIYLPSLTNKFIWDDHDIIQRNYLIRHGSIERIFTSPYAPRFFSPHKLPYYRPMPILLWHIIYKLFGLNALAFRLTNLIIYIILIILIYNLTRSLFDKRIALLSTFLFALHPTHVESVAFPSGISDILATVFIILSFMSYTKNNILGVYILSPIWFFLALLSKETSAMFIFIVLAYDFIFATKKKINRLIIHKLIFLIILFIYFILRKHALMSSTLPVSKYIFKRLAFVAYVLIRHLSNLILPLWTAPYHGEYIKSLSIITAVLTWAFLIAILIIFKKHITSKALIKFSLLWFILFFVPTSGIFSYKGAMWAERHIFTVSVGAFWVIAYIIHKLTESKFISQKMIKLIIYAYIIFLSLLSASYAFYWRNDWMLYRKMIESAPNNPIGYSDLAALYSDYGYPDSTIYYAKKAIELDPTYIYAYANLGQAYITKSYMAADDSLARKAYLDSAELSFTKQLIISKGFGGVYSNLGIVYMEKNQPEKALEAFKKAAELLPTSPSILYNLGLAYLVTGDTNKAKIKLKKAYTIYPEDKMIKNKLIELYLAVGDTGEAIKIGWEKPLAKPSSILKH